MSRVNEWVEAAGSSVDVAVEAALAELGIDSRDQVEIEVLREPVKGVFGTGWRAQDALVKVTPKPPDKKRRRRGGRRRSRSGSSPAEGSSSSRNEGAQRGSKGRDGGSGRSSSDQQKAGSRPDRSSDSGNGRSGGRSQTRGKAQPTGTTAQAAAAKAPSQKRKAAQRPSKDADMSTKPQENATNTPPVEEATIEDQAAVAAEFIKGLLDAYGLEGEVETKIDDDILKIEVTGDQTEALVGRRGAIMQSVLDVTRTVVQRKTFGAPRMRIDINGYGERRREALRIYTRRQAERIVEEGGEIMLEPMNAADRKVIHDTVAEIDGVHSFSEGEEPDRAVVIASGD